MSYDIDRGRFIEVLRGEGVPEAVALLVLRNATTLDRIAVKVCNVERSEAEEARDDRTEERAEARITAALEPFRGIKAVFSGDPRGAVVRLKLPSGHYDNWDGEHYGVPTR